MHAASVYPEPGSNSPKRCTILRPRLLSEGLTTRTSLSRISCHSSVVKVQRPRRDGPRRRRRMMRLGGRGVKPDDLMDPGFRSRPARPPVEAARAANGMGGAGGLSNGAAACRRRPAPTPAQIGLVSTSRMKAAPLSQQSSASSAEPGDAERPDERRRRRAGPRSGRGAGLGQAEQDLEDEVAHRPSDRPPALEGADQGHLVGVLEVAADRQAAGDPADRADRPPRGARRGTSRSPRPRASGWWP